MAITKYDVGCCRCTNPGGGCGCCTGSATGISLTGMNLYRPFTGPYFNPTIEGWCVNRSLFSGCTYATGASFTEKRAWDGVTNLLLGNGSSPLRITDPMPVYAAFGTLATNPTLYLRTPPYVAPCSACQPGITMGVQEIKPLCTNTGSGVTGWFCTPCGAHNYINTYSTSAFNSNTCPYGPLSGVPTYPSATRVWQSNARATAWIGLSTIYPTGCRLHLTAWANTTWVKPEDIHTCYYYPNNVGQYSANYWASDILAAGDPCPSSVPLILRTRYNSGGQSGSGADSQQFNFWPAQWSIDTVTASITY